MELLGSLYSIAQDSSRSKEHPAAVKARYKRQNEHWVSGFRFLGVFGFCRERKSATSPEEYGQSLLFILIDILHYHSRSLLREGWSLKGPTTVLQRDGALRFFLDHFL